MQSLRRFNRLLPVFALACVPVCSFVPTLAQDATALPAASAGSAVDPALKRDVADFWHYGKIARYDLANDAANKLTSTEPVKLLEAFEAVARDSKGQVDTWMIRWVGVDKMKDVTTKLNTILDEGRRTRRADPAYIATNIKALGASSRSYQLAVERLRDSGELAVPMMLDQLADPAMANLHGPIRNALRDLGQLALNPLVAATQGQESPVLLSVIEVLRDTGYKSSVPYLARLAQKGQSTAIQNAARSALARMGSAAAADTPAGDQFYDLAEEFYYDKSSIRPDTRNPQANIWTMTPDRGLQRAMVPQSIFNFVMAMRSAKEAMSLNTQRDALSFYLLANYKREAALGTETDGTTPAGTPSAHFYGVAAGTQYLNAALSRALSDRDPAVALKIVKSLQEIVGRSNLLAGPKGDAITDALRFGDRQVRFEAAFTVAAALPTQPFATQDRVVPLLAEAIHQNGVPGVLVLYPADKYLAKIDELKASGYAAAGGANANEAFTAAGNLPSIAIILTTDDVDRSEIENLFTLANRSPRLDQAPRVIVSKSMSTSIDPMISYTPAIDAPGQKVAIEAARSKAGGIALDEKIATGFALRSADLMAKLAINNNKLLDVTTAQPSLLAALEDNRPDVVKAVGNVLALFNDKAVQNALATKASNEKTPDEVKVALFKSLASNAKTFGNQLEGDRVAAVQKAVASGTNLDVRSAAAEARGALNLPVDEARSLILDKPQDK